MFIFALQTEKGNAALQNALTNPCNYVLKPQREGSGQ